jgi:hypothetical protein
MHYALLIRFYTCAYNHKKGVQIKCYQKCVLIIIFLTYHSWNCTCAKSVPTYCSYASFLMPTQSGIKALYPPCFPQISNKQPVLNKVGYVLKGTGCTQCHMGLGIELVGLALTPGFLPQHSSLRPCKDEWANVYLCMEGTRTLAMQCARALSCLPCLPACLSVWLCNTHCR